MDLSAIRILDLSRLLPGPYGTQILSDMGAEVIKIEDPDDGDYARYAEPISPDEIGTAFSAINKGKKSVTLNLKSEQGREIFYELVEDADVIVEQFRPGVVENLGIDYASVRERDPDIVYCSLSGFGQTGPYRERVGHDLNYVSFAGLLDMTRAGPDGRPIIPGYPIADMAGGVFAAISVIGSLLSSQLGTTDGTHIDVSMTEAVLSFSHAVSPLALHGDDPRSGATELTGRYPCYDVYETKDGKYITISALEFKFWRNLCTELGLEDIIGNHRSDDPAVRMAVRERLEDTFLKRSRSDWEAALHETDVMFAPVKSPDEALNDDQVQCRNLVKDPDGRYPRVGFPGLVDGERPGDDESIPGLGEHTRPVLKRLGYSEELDELSDDNVI